MTFNAPPPIPPSFIGGKALGEGHRSPLQARISLPWAWLPVAASSSASCLKPWPPTSGCPGNQKEASGLQHGECLGHW